MQLVLAVIFAGLGLWRGWLDWQATIGQGYAFRAASIDAVWAENFPGAHGEVVQVWQSIPIGFLWDPVGMFLLGLPLTVLLLGIAFLLWVTRRRGRGRG